jgi:predicted O-methyltransferase YrrM
MDSAIHAFKCLLGLDTPESQVTAREIECLMKYAKSSDVIVELGCYEGGTTAALGKAARGQVHSIDPFPAGKVGVCYGELIARTHCWKQGVRNVEFLKGFSYQVASKFEQGIDLLFIDADHDFEAVKRDWDDWFPKVKKGGFIAMHDSLCVACSPQHLGSMKFYDDCVRSNPNVKVVAEVDSLAVLQVIR